jgi:type I restriction enzyme, R subunit
MARRTAFLERDFQGGVFVPYLTQNPERGLTWLQGDPLRMSSSDRARWIYKEDLACFLAAGSEANSTAFDRLLPLFDNDAGRLVEAFVEEALLPKMAQCENASRLLRESITFRDQSFRLWNEAPKVGQSQQQSDEFSLNRGRVFTELPFERDLPQAGKFNRRPDATFFVNGIFLSAAELKANQTGQSAGVNGRKKIAHNLVELAKLALSQARVDWAASNSGAWPGYGSDRLPAAARNKIRSDCAVFVKACHVVAVDMGALYVSTDLDWVLVEVDRVLSGPSPSIEISRLPDMVAEKMSRAPEIAGMTPWETVAEHLESLYSLRDGVDREAFYFNQTWTPNSSNEQTEPLKPRPAQRIMLHRTVKRVRELYADESKPKFAADDIRRELASTMPTLSASQIDEIVDESVSHKNGANSHSILLQGAAGLGKTFLIVWLAQALYHLRDDRGHAYQPLFDLIILLTDRTELRDNLAKDAAKLGSTNKIVKEASTFKELREAVDGTTRIVVVNIQKFASLQKLAAQDPQLDALLRSKRVAVLIDEVHRSQSGAMHDATLELFNDWDALTPDAGKRNLIVGLTATPKDDALARLGEWRKPAAPGDQVRWMPFAAYSMAQAIRDGVVLNPVQNILRYSDELEYDQAASQAAAASQGLPDSALVAPSSNSVYESLSRQRLVAQKIASVFASKTMMAIRRRGLLVGEGKAMVACHSIKAAISMQALLKEELQKLSADPAYKDRAAHLAACPVLILYSDKQSEMRCAELNDGKGQKAVLDEFRRKGVEAASDEPGKVKCRNAVIVVVDMLLTGFDEKTLHTIFIDRSLDDVALFQAACRINRVKKHKDDCMIVDFSRDGVVSKNLPIVFEKYGGLTVSKLDALHLRDKMEAAWKEFFADKDMEGHFRVWKATLAGGKDHQGAVKLSNYLDQLASDERSRALALRKAASAWMNSRQKLWGLVDFDKQGLQKHKDARQVEFAEQVVKHLASKTKAEDQSVEMVFDVVQVEQAEAIELTVHGEGAPEDSAAAKVRELAASTGLAVADISHSLDMTEILQVLQKTEDDKAAAIQILRDFVTGLFEEIYARGESSDNHGNSGAYRKALARWSRGEADFPWDDRIGHFRRLFNKARSSAKFVGVSFAAVALPALGKRLELLMDDYDRYVLAKA